MTTFTDKQTTVTAAWLNGVDALANTALNGAQTTSQVLTALGLTGVAEITSLPIPIAQGGTGATTAGTALSALGGVSLAAINPTFLGNQLTPQTVAEATAGVTPINIWYPPGCIERYYAGGDATTAIQAALNCNTYVTSFYGQQTPFSVSSYLLVPGGVTIENVAILATTGIPQYSPWGGDQQGQIFLLNGDRAKARRLQINCGGVAAGGIAIRNFSNNDASENEIYNGLSQGILILCNIGPGVLGATNFTVNGNRIYYMNHGIQHWRARGGAITGNAVRVIAGGGIWGAGSADVVVTGNQISDCGDVGLDMEGGANCIYSGNSVKSCNNGELTWFVDGTGSTLTPTNCLITNNNAWHTATYLAWNGSAEVQAGANSGGATMWLTGAAANQRGITFSNNQCRADVGSALLVNDLYGSNPPYDCGFMIDGNKFFAAASTASLHTVQRAWNIVVKNNLFHAMQGSEVNSNQFKNCSNGVWDSNLYEYEFTPSGGAYALLYYTDVNVPVSPQITNNRFVNTGDFAFKHQPFNSHTGAVLSGNLFTTSYTLNGGCLVTTDGTPVCRAQRLYISIGATINLTSLLVLGNSQSYSTGSLACLSNGTLQNCYNFTYASNGLAVVSRDGSGSGSGSPGSSSTFATFSGSVITISASGPAANIVLEVNTTL